MRPLLFAVLLLWLIGLTGCGDETVAPGYCDYYPDTWGCPGYWLYNQPPPQDPCSTDPTLPGCPTSDS